MPYTCFNKRVLSVLNRAWHPEINLEPGVQAIANSIGKLNGYVELIETTLGRNATRDNRMKALRDVLQGIVQDLSAMVSIMKKTRHFLVIR